MTEDADDFSQWSRAAHNHCDGLYAPVLTPRALSRSARKMGRIDVDPLYGANLRQIERPEGVGLLDGFAATM